MQEILIQKLHTYIVQNNPDLLLSLQDSISVNRYLEEKVASVDTLIQQMLEEHKPAYIIEDACIEAMTRDLRPSKYNYLLAVLMDYFEAAYYKMLESGTLTFELINLLSHTKDIFEDTPLTDETEGDKQLRRQVAAAVKDYLQQQQQP